MNEKETTGVMDWIKLLRVKQWVKNGFVLAPLVFAVEFTKLDSIIRALEAMVVFCIVSSGTYILNDLKDREADALHPAKRNRPIAAGRIKPPQAWAGAFILLLGGCAWGFSMGGNMVLTVLAYVLIHMAYTFGLKEVAIIDVSCIAIGFVLRVIGGAEAINVEYSEWVLLCTFLLASFLGFAKRRQEIILLGENAAGHREVLVQYSPQMLDQILTLSAACSIIAYALYTISAQTQGKFDTQALIYTVPFVYYGFARYFYLIHQEGKGDDPTEVVYTDRPMLLNGILWAAACGLIVYWKKVLIWLQSMGL
ncbi:MAG TPA: decaprenyl-phosphate phosphoribosyltransferase [Candidatus Brocadiia bacterium]|nr:decaprenyl-phosphate phosphoribosyltransferase [Candidatus Brocadiia bacterium]